MRLGISVGAAVFDWRDGQAAERLPAAADRAMYVVKAASGGGASLAGSAP